MSFCPENIGNSSSRQNKSELFPRYIQSFSRLLQGASCRKLPSALFRSNWVKYNLWSDRNNSFLFRSDGRVVFDPVGLKKCWRWFLQLGPWRSGKQLWIYLEESSDSFWGEEDQFPTSRGKSSCERTEMYFINGLQTQLHKNWPQAVYYAIWFRACDFYFSIWKRMGLLMQSDLAKSDGIKSD